MNSAPMVAGTAGAVLVVVASVVAVVWHRRRKRDPAVKEWASGKGSLHSRGVLSHCHRWALGPRDSDSHGHPYFPGLLVHIASL